MPEIIDRWQKRQVEHALTQRRVVLLAGARQCGKTTLARSLVAEGVEYRTLDDATLRQTAQVDPLSFVRHQARTLVIDEVQRVPELLPAIKMAVDDDTQPGRFLLTGSANINAIPSVNESLAGRISKIRLRPLAQGERSGDIPDFLERAFSNHLQPPSGALDRDGLLDLAFMGGYPEALELSNRERERWHTDYIAALLDRDLREIAQIRRTEAMRKLVEVSAAWSSKPMDISGITTSLAIRRPTVESYLNALEALYIVERLPAWTRTDYERVSKHPKIFMTDPGLMASVLEWRKDQVRLDADRAGKLVETMAFNELAAQVDCHGEVALYHFRNWDKREIDFLVERKSDGALLAIEVKASETVGKGDFKHLAWFRDTLGSQRPFQGIVLYSGERLLSFGEKLKAVPFPCLWSAASVS